MKRILLLVVAAMSLTTACTDNQLLRWVTARDAAEATADPADDAQVELAVQSYLTTKALFTAGRPCEQWYDTAMDNGWVPEEWPTLSRVMWGESRCDPGADNSQSTARGLLQELEMWADDCGGTYESLYDPAFNLRCGKHILDVSSWEAWEAY